MRWQVRGAELGLRCVLIGSPWWKNRSLHFALRASVEMTLLYFEDYLTLLRSAVGRILLCPEIEMTLLHPASIERALLEEIELGFYDLPLLTGGMRCL